FLTVLGKSYFHNICRKILFIELFHKLIKRSALPVFSLKKKEKQKEGKKKRKRKGKSARLTAGKPFAWYNVSR
ncbi:hypothetical protein BTI12_06835, partial [Lactobacillus delbrueckii subsp. bulgaricus]|nr:hypothetical protein [Lactobacillus delbrueckii subsp. bulgaricus]